MTFNSEFSDSARLMACMQDVLQHASPYKQEVLIVWGDEPSTPESARFGLRLVEDSIYGFMSYTDFLCKLHATIRKTTNG